MNRTESKAGKLTKASKAPAAVRVVAKPVSASAVVAMDGEVAFDHPGAKASIQCAEIDGEWIAEFKFRFRSGLFQACTLPLTTSSERRASRAKALGGAALRLLESLRSALAGDTLGKAQQAAADALQTWAQGLADAGAAADRPLHGLRFLDVFAGIGGFHIALSELGASCAGAIELDAEARKTYRANHAGSYPLHDDVRTASPSQFGQVDIVCGGFPCQSFSMAGDRAGFEDASKGALFFEIARLIRALSPSIAILENVKGLCSHDQGRTFEAVLDTLTGLGYSASTRVLNAGDFGLPQMRERLFFVCLHDRILTNRSTPYVFPRGADASKVVADILGRSPPGSACTRPMARLKPDPKGRSQRIEVVGLIDGKDCQGYRVASSLGKGFTLCANSGGIGGKTGLYRIGGKVRALTKREAARMQGFPESFKPHASDRAALKQFGNSVAVPQIAAISRLIPGRTVRHSATQKLPQKPEMPIDGNFMIE